MVCRRCRLAADLNVEALEFQVQEPVIVDKLHALAKQLHDHCLYPGCTCQHKDNVRVGINHTRIGVHHGEHE